MVDSPFFVLRITALTQFCICTVRVNNYDMIEKEYDTRQTFLYVCLHLTGKLILYVKIKNNLKSY